MTKQSLIKVINFIEKKIGRTRSKKNDPRVCDIDIIDFKGLIIEKNNLKIPHEKCHLRNFVLYPILGNRLLNGFTQLLRKMLNF